MMCKELSDEGKNVCVQEFLDKESSASSGSLSTYSSKTRRLNTVNKVPQRQGNLLKILIQSQHLRVRFFLGNKHAKRGTARCSIQDTLHNIVAQGVQRVKITVVLENPMEGFTNHMSPRQKGFTGITGGVFCTEAKEALNMTSQIMQLGPAG